MPDDATICGFAFGGDILREQRAILEHAVAHVEFTQNIQRHVACAPRQRPGACVREVLEAVFAEVDRLRGYVLDERGEVRKHIVIFVDGKPIRDRVALSDAVDDRTRIHVMQALSGG